MEYLVTILLIASAIYGISWALVYSDGPLGLLYKVREVKIVDRFGIFNCLPCTAFWVSLPLILIIGWWFIGVWGIVVLLDQIINSLGGR